MKTVGRESEGRGNDNQEEYVVGGRAGKVRLLAVMVAVSGAGSLLATRLADPLSVDEPLTIFVAFFIVPGLLIAILTAIHRIAGAAAAAAIPFAWLAVASERGDAGTLWLIPVAAGVAVLVAAFRVRRGVIPRGAVWAALAVAAAALLCPSFCRAPVWPRVIVVGIDGASWRRIDPLVEAGRLPNFERLLDGGHRARLRSLDSMGSPQVWSTIATGCPPELHGIWDFGYTQRDLRVGRIWDRMRADGRSFGVCGWYFTWPPPEHLKDNDFVIPSTIARDCRTCPPEYSFYWQLWARESPKSEETIPYGAAAVSAFKHGVRLSTLRRAVFEVVRRQFRRAEFLDRAWRDRRLSADLQADVFCELVRTRQPEFAAILMNQVDKVSHLYWKFMDPEGFPDVTEADRARYCDCIDCVYEQMDRNLGKILEVAPVGADVLIVSDHGFRPAKRKVAALFCRVRTENLIEALDDEGELFGMNVDQKVYLRPLAGSLEEREAVSASLRKALGGAHLSDETAPFFEVCQEGDCVRFEIAARDAIPWGARLVIDGEAHPVEDLVTMRSAAQFSGEHHPDGVYLLAGPSAGRAALTDSLHVMDVAPTIAALLELPFSEQWRGRPALGDFSEDEIVFAAYPAPSEAPDQPSQIDEGLKQQLRSMGYLQ